mgnify:CR=1 FL=1
MYYYLLLKLDKNELTISDCAITFNGDSSDDDTYV